MISTNLQLENETDRQAIKHTSGLTTAIAPSGISFYLFVWLYMTKKKSHLFFLRGKTENQPPKLNVDLYSTPHTESY